MPKKKWGQVVVKKKKKKKKKIQVQILLIMWFIETGGPRGPSGGHFCVQW